MTADTRLIFISPEDDPKIKPVLFTYTRAQHLFAHWSDFSIIYSARAAVVFIPGNSEATPPLWRRLAVVLFISGAGLFNWLL